MQNLSARLKLQVFRDDFTECQFLLNLGSGPAEHLGRGIDRAQRTLDQQGIDRSGDWRPDSWVRRLTAAEQASVREQTAELILLEARARVYLAERAGTEADAEAGSGVGRRLARPGRAARPDAPRGPLRRPGPLPRRAGPGRPRRRRTAAARPPPSPVSSRDFYLLGSALLARGDLARAEPALRQAVDLDPRGFWAWFALGHCHFEQGRALDAAGDFAACVVLEPKFAWPHLNRGLALAAAGRLVEARACLRPRPGGQPPVRRGLAQPRPGRPRAERPGRRRAGLGRAWALGRRESGVLAVWAEVKARRGRRDEAEQLFDRLLRDRPDDPVLLTARGVFRIATDPAGAECRPPPRPARSTRATPAPTSAWPCCSARARPARRWPRPTPPSPPTRTSSTPSSSAPCSAPGSATSRPSTTPSA